MLMVMHNRRMKALPKVSMHGYAEAGASFTKRVMRGWREESGSPARDIDDANETLRQRSRMLYMSAPIATSAIRTVRTNAIGEGLRPMPRPDREVLGMTQEQAQAWAKHVQREFALWAENRQACDSTGLNTFYEMQQLAVISWLVSGDVFALVKKRAATTLRPYSLRLHLVEADRVATPTRAGHPLANSYTTGTNEKTGNSIFDGVEVDDNGGIVAYHIRNGHPADMPLKAEKFTRILAHGRLTGLPNVLHVMDSERPDQYRGVSYLAQVIEPLLQMRRYTSSELTAAVIESYFTVFIETENAAEQPFNDVAPEYDEANSLAGDNEYEMGPGNVNHLYPGEKAYSLDPKRPNSAFEQFISTLCRQIGAALEIPGELLLKTFNSSYSASRAALMEAWKSFRMRRRWFVADFCEPTWELWMSEAVARGRIKAPGFFDNPIKRAAYLACEWVGPSPGQLDPVKEINAELLAIDAGITTREAAAERLNGSSWDENMDRLQHESQRIANLAPKTMEGTE